jgi:hypothetical protein
VKGREREEYERGRERERSVKERERGKEKEIMLRKGEERCVVGLVGEGESKHLLLYSPMQHTAKCIFRSL